MSRYINPKQQILDLNGVPIIGAKKFFFETGSGTTLKTIYSDSGLQVPRANPALSDSAGRFPSIFLDGIYKEEQQDNSGTTSGYDGVTLWTEDPVGDTTVESEFQPWNNSTPYIVGSFVKGSDGEYYQSKTDPNTGNDPTITPALWALIKFNEVWNSTTDYPVGDTAYASDGFEYLSNSTPNIGNDPRSSGKWIPATRQGQSAIATGTVDAITVAFSPVFTALKDGLEVRVRASGANTINNPTLSIDGIPAETVTKMGGQPLAIGDISGAGYEMILKYNLSLGKWELLNLPNEFSNTIAQSLQATTNAIITSTTIMVGGVAAPQNTEGAEVLTLSITPAFANSKIRIHFQANFAINAQNSITLALFKNSDVNAIASSWTATSSIVLSEQCDLNFEYQSISLTPITFRIRAGASSTTLLVMNGNSAGTTILGGTFQATLRATEVRA